MDTIEVNKLQKVIYRAFDKACPEKACPEKERNHQADWSISLSFIFSGKILEWHKETKKRLTYFDPEN